MATSASPAMELSHRFRSRCFVIETDVRSSRFAPVNLKGMIRSPWTFSSSERTARCTKHLEEFFRSATGGVLANTNQNMKTCNLSCRDKAARSRPQSEERESPPQVHLERRKVCRAA